MFSFLEFVENTHFAANCREKNALFSVAKCGTVREPLYDDRNDALTTLTNFLTRFLSATIAIDDCAIVPRRNISGSPTFIEHHLPCASHARVGLTRVSQQLLGTRVKCSLS